MIILCQFLQVPVSQILIDCVENKNEIRKHIAEDNICSIKEAKEAINACLYGAKPKYYHKWLNDYAKAIKQTVLKLLSKTDNEDAKVRVEAARKRGQHKILIASALSARFNRIEWQLVYHVQQFLETKGFLISHMIPIFDGIEVHRPSNNNEEITTEILDEIYDYLKTTLKVGATFSCERRVDGELIKIKTTRKIEILTGIPFITIDRLPIKKTANKLNIIQYEEDEDSEDERVDGGGNDVIGRGEGEIVPGGEGEDIRQGVECDRDAALYVISQYPNIYYSEGKLHVYNGRTGLYSTDKVALYAIIERYSHKLHIIESPKGEGILYFKMRWRPRARE